MIDLKNWKLKLRYGKTTTPYRHYTVLAQVKIENYIEDFEAEPGTAWAGIKLWATDTNEAIDIVKSVAIQTGFKVIGNIEVFDSEAVEPPRDNPFAYDINFSYYID